jgi:putative Mg2+ transporter-C (MgtC) family protein
MFVWEIALRIGLAVIAGGIIGAQREYKGNSAGLRTHILVSVGACIAMLTNEYLVLSMGDISDIDVSRMASYVISGIGFLGAGSIIKDGIRVRGLTTAAGLWVVACLGITAGAGFYWATGIGCAVVIVVMTVLKVFENKVLKVKHRTLLELNILNKPGQLAKVLKVLGHHGLSIRDIDLSETEEEIISAKITTTLLGVPIEKLTEELEKVEGTRVKSIELT